MDTRDAEDRGREFAERRIELEIARATGRVGVARAEAVASASAVGGGGGGRRAAPGVRWGWRRAVAFAVRQRMVSPEYWGYYARYLAQRARHPRVEMDGMVFFGRRVELQARARHGRLALGPWCWIGTDNRLRAHEGNVRLGPKVVLGRDNVVNGYLDIEIGRNALLGDWIYVCDFDHRHERVDVPIKKQGIAKSPVRIGEDVWIGEKASILRGADIGAGSVIASQALVRGPIPPFSIAVGSPARVVRSRLPAGMTAEEALDLQRRGAAIPGDPLDG